MSIFMKSIFLIIACCFLRSVSPNSQTYNAIFSFGDSLADTGNFLILDSSAFPVIGKLPYGETFFKHPTGRCSNGRLIVDFFAEAYGLPLLPPYLALKKGVKAEHGVNFAIAGSTAIAAKYFYSKNITILWTNMSLTDQLGWFQEVKAKICATQKDCREYLKQSLFIVGEIGGNDYNYPYFLGGSIKQLKALVPAVVETIIKATSVLIEEGAVELIVPGNLPIGCSAVYLTLFGTPNKAAYDNNGCLKSYNAFSKYHNAKLKLAIESLRKEYPHAKIIYADYYGAAERLFHAPKHYGFSNIFVACCGGGGPYNFNYSARCGHIGSKACLDSSSFVNWDGMHLTETAYHHIAKGLLNGPFTSPSLTFPPIKQI
ncbi:GDSL esterase/lipase At5g45910-like [Lycium ferocissimum]|uniref:GDSL esterase/lipase At5g45910-like n=1 Tax=Lycium ferocissimum TaxID=112874 RepID=UPI0028167D19|nr:GDSL esterase/lipase At5g45910-like [Lycium ferocissimum]